MIRSYHSDCRLFSGYKPCRHKRPCEGCPNYDPVKTRVVIVSLEALGAVLRSTCLLKPIRRKYPDAHITWITLPNAAALLQGNPEIDRVIYVDATTQAVLNSLRFDVLFAVDKSLEAGSIAQQMRADEKYGFGIDAYGNIIPLSKHAQYQYDVGLDDELKFFVNAKPETQQLTESMNLDWQRDPYILELSPKERTLAQNFRLDLCAKSGVDRFFGYNTGCSTLFPYKKFTVSRAAELISAWMVAFPEWGVLLLGGREDRDRNEALKARFMDEPRVQLSPCDQGLRAGILWMEASNIVFSGCSLGLHIAIGLGKPTVSWFGVTCAQEIDDYGRGRKLKAAVPCAPCWKKNCDNEPKCYDRVDPVEIVNACQDLVRAEVGVRELSESPQ